MNEEIDVSGCKLRTENNEMACFVICNEYPDCYYKKLKRLEAENANLKEKYQEELTVNTQLRRWQDEDLRQIKELKIENDHLIANIKEKEKYLYEQEYLDKGMEKLRQENAKLKKENEILQTSLEMIKNTEGQAHIKAIELTKKLDKIKEKINAHCAVCETIRRPKCDDCILSWLLEIIEGAKNE